MKVQFVIIILAKLIFCLSVANASSFDSSNHIVESTEKVIELTKVEKEHPLNKTKENLDTFNNLLTAYNIFSQNNVEFSLALLNKIKGHQTLSGAELFYLRYTIITFYKISNKFLEYAKTYNYSEPGLIENILGRSSYKNVSMLKAHLIRQTSYLVMIDHITKMHEILYENDDKFRRIIKNALKDKVSEEFNVNTTLKNLGNMIAEISSEARSSRFIQQNKLILGSSSDIRSKLKNDVQAIRLLDIIITSSTSKEITRGVKSFTFENYSIQDAPARLINNGVGIISGLAGNLAGSIRWRKGHLYKNRSAIQKAKSNLIPMDIIIEKSPFILTDKFIPGHFGHIAIYLGTKEQLLDANIWNHPSIVPFQEEIIKGKVILEAVRSGVRLNSLEEFLNVDEITIMRKNDGLENIDLVNEEITRGIDQIGKAYDFNFDISTLDKIVCSELIYIVFGHVNWPTQYRLGRATITPDDVAEVLFQKNTKYEVVSVLIGQSNAEVSELSINYLLDIFNFETRRFDGSPVIDPNDKSNSFWKIETKCYNTLNESNETTKICKTKYKELYYSEIDKI